MKLVPVFRPPWSGQAPWLPSFSTLVVWGAAAASLVFWSIRWTDPLSSPDAVAQVEQVPGVDVVALAQWLGAGSGGSPTSPLSGRFKVLGVVTDHQGVGAALISIDGQPARPYRVGTQVEKGLVLQKLLSPTGSIGFGAQGVGAGHACCETGFRVVKTSGTPGFRSLLQTGNSVALKTARKLCWLWRVPVPLPKYGRSRHPGCGSGTG
jgi:general secretion pathway protein C